MKLFNYELAVMSKFYIYDYLEKYSTFENFLDDYSYVQRELSRSGEYLTLKKSKNSNEENMSLSNLTITVDTCCLEYGADFALWQNSECIILEGYSYEDKWLRPECEIKFRK